MLAEKLDSYENVKPSSQKLTKLSNSRFSRNTGNPEFRKSHSFKVEKNISGNHNSAFANPSYMPAQNTNTGFHPPISCYGCGNPGFIKSKCPKCSLKKESASVNAIHMFTYLTSPVALLDIEVYEATGTVCADTGASQSVEGELMFNFLRNCGQKFSEFHLAMCLADGQQSTSLVQKATVPITVGGRTFQIYLIFLPHAKGNRTLLGVDFLRTSGIVIDMRNNFWYFGDKPSFRVPFSKDVPLPVDDSPVEINSSSCPTNSIPSEIPLHSNTVDENETNDLHLREEGQALNVEERNDLRVLLNESKDVFRLGGEPTPFVKHFINTEECESPYAAPVVLVPKSNGTVRLCIDYRKLNAITIPDKYPLPLMDVLLHDAKSTAFMSTLDLKSGYHQVKINPADQDKTAFVCPFGTFRYKRMPFGLRNAPATFQRLMDQFRNGLPNVNTLVYLDDIVVLSETFEQRIEDLRMVFDRLKKFKLCAKREKCKFVCSRVKYLGLWITPKGIEVDQDKTAAMQNIPSPRNLKQLQSFLQTCSWYRKFIPNFSDIARPLSNLSKKSTAWKWSEIEQQAFQTLKQCLITPPILRQVDPKKPFIIRTDASSYALGAVLLQGESPTDEQPVEYASRLLSSAEKNYSTTEREALAVDWALNKFRGYIEGAEITVASDHQQPEYRDEKICELKTIIIDFPTRTANELKTEQLKDLELKKIIDCFENPNKGVDPANWTGRGYVMNQGVLYRYSPHAEVEEAQLNALDTKPLIRTLQVFCRSQRFESIAIDLFGPLETTEGMKWIFIVEDYTTKWVELFPLKQATAKECAMTLLNEVFLRDTECPVD
ncbi:retrovirus-related Pol polyprotein from transposon 17.6 [Trichonephila clavipes]|nr:retrovirus-related Pol polyprotein from transposon 17.6 [Trichonephila clavipes]